MATRSKPLATRSGRKLVARRDTLDFRDLMYVPSLVEVPPVRSLASYRARKIPILDQGQEGACTGFGLATVANYLLYTRKIKPDRRKVSPWMLYDLARRYDEWPGEKYEGSSARGAMKGWHKHGVCTESLWNKTGNPAGNRRRTTDPYDDALDRPLGAYFRVNHKDLVAMHAAMTEAGILYATSDVHEGWDNVKANGLIRRSDTVIGGHAFALVAYDEQGFWIQNSWGPGWGKSGFGHISYDDWLANGTDVWVARLGVPVQLQEKAGAAAAASDVARSARAVAIRDLRQHIVSVGNDGLLRPGGEYGSTADSVAELVDTTIPAAIKGWRRKRLMLFAHGGLVPEDAAVEKVSAYRTTLLDAQVYPVSFIWKTDYLTTLKNILQDAMHQRQSEGALDAAKDFMLDRLDDALEPIARVATGKAEWDEMKENAEQSSSNPDGGARLFVDRLRALAAKYPRDFELHIVAHSAGSIFMGPVIRALTTGTRPLPIASVSLWAPACTMDLFNECYLPAIESGGIQRFALYTLTDRAEQDDNCANIYHKSLLYLVSNAFENPPRIPMFRDGVPVLGMEKFVKAHDKLMALVNAQKVTWVRAPNADDEGSPMASTAAHHGDFDNDKATMLGTLNRIAGASVPANALTMGVTSADRRERRLGLRVPE